MDELNNRIKENMQLYFKAKDGFQYLTEDNKILVGQVENYIAILPSENPVKKTIDGELDKYFSKTKEVGDLSGMQIADDLRQTQPLALVREKKEEKPSSRAAFINIAILLYGMVNVGFIIAMALIRNFR